MVYLEVRNLSGGRLFPYSKSNNRVKIEMYSSYIFHTSCNKRKESMLIVSKGEQKIFSRKGGADEISQESRIEILLLLPP